MIVRISCRLDDIVHDVGFLCEYVYVVLRFNISHVVPYDSMQ